MLKNNTKKLEKKIFKMSSNVRFLWFLLNIDRNIYLFKWFGSSNEAESTLTVFSSYFWAESFPVKKAFA